MNIFFSTQDASLDMFNAILERIREPLGIRKAGFAVVNSVYYHNFLRHHPDFEKRNVVVKEWEIYRSARTERFDPDELRRYESELGDPTLWTPLVIDRRIFHGPRCTFDLDYRARLTHEEMQRVLLAGCRIFDRVFREIEPSVVMTVYTATLADSLVHLFAQRRGAINLDLRAARVRNFVMWARGFEKPPPHIRRLSENYERSGIPENIRMQAEEFIETFKNRQVVYEGGVVKRKHFTLRIRQPKGALQNVVSILKNQAVLGRDDPYLEGSLKASVYKRLIHPLRSFFFPKVAGDRFVAEGSMVGSPYVFFPLHVEPELVLARWARPWLNQMEAIRNIAFSIPAGWKVLVKEHPQMMGRRSLSYYRKLLMIPNVALYDPWSSTVPAVAGSRGVFVIRGALALDGAIYGKPVICLGHSLWDMLPPHMARMVENPYRLAEQFADLVANYRWDREALVKMIAVLIGGSCPVDLVTGLLGKKDRVADGHTAVPLEEHPHLEALSEYTVMRIREEQSAVYETLHSRKVP